MFEDEEFMENEKKKIGWLEFDLFKSYPDVIHGCFNRHGGASSGHFTSLNVSDYVGDHSDCVKVNREKICEVFNIPNLIFPHQTHSVNIVRITAQNQLQAHVADSLYTTEKNIGLCASTADCQAAVFYDSKHKVIAVAHAGWRGSVQNIYGKVVDQLKKDIGTNPKDLFVGISPSLGPCHAEFKNYKQELPKEFWPFQSKPHYFDFWKISRMQLMNAGIPEKNIEIAEICNYCNNDYFSYRREPKCGRNATVIALK